MMAASLKPTPARDSSQKLGNMEHTVQPAGTSAGWRLPFSSNSGLNIFQAARLVSASSKSGLWVFFTVQFVCESSQDVFSACLRETLTFIAYSGIGGLANLIGFRDFLTLFWVANLPGISLQDGMFQFQRKLYLDGEKPSQ